MKCPNCGGEIGRFELAPNCKHCGINIFYSQQELLLSRDAKRCELEYASLRILVSKLKTAFIKGPLPIWRLVLTLLTLCAVLVPFASAKTDLPMIEKGLTFSALGLYSAFSDGTFGAVFNLLKDGFLPAFSVGGGAVLVTIVLITLCAAALLVEEILSFINITKVARAMMKTAFIGAVISLISAGACLFFALRQGEAFLTSHMGVGAFVALALFIGDVIINRLFITRNVQADVNEVDLERIRIRKQVKAGEINLDDLPLPVLESEEEKAKRLEREAKMASAKAGEEGDGNG